MLDVFEDYFGLLEKLHHDIAAAIADLPPDALDWVPGPDMNSLAVLVVHLTGAERYWIGDVAGQESSARDRAAEFTVRGLDAATLEARLQSVLAHSRSVLEKLNLADLDKERISTSDGKTYRVAWALDHALEHTALHLGHVQIVRQLLVQRGE